MFFKTRGRFSVIYPRPSMRDDWEKSSRFKKNIVNYLISHTLFQNFSKFHKISIFFSKFSNFQNFKISKFWKFENFEKKFEILWNFIKFHKISKFSKNLQIFIKYMYYRRHGWNIWYNIVLLRDVFHIGLVIGPRPALLAQPNANTADRGPITRPIWKTSCNDTFIN